MTDQSTRDEDRMPSLSRTDTMRPTSVLKQHFSSSTASATLTDTSPSSVPVSPQLSATESDESDTNTDDERDALPPVPARESLQVHATAHSARSKHVDRQRLSLPQQHHLPNSASRVHLPLPHSPLASGSSSSTRASLSFDLQPSRDTSSNDAPLPTTATGDYTTLQTFPQTLPQMRDSLAVDATDVRTSSRVSVAHVGARPLDADLSPFLYAARTGDLATLTTALASTTLDVTQRDAAHGQTALHIAVRFGHLAAVQLLCLAPATRAVLLDSVDRRLNTPLHLAAVKSQRITQVLVACGADATRVNSRAQTALGVHVLTTRRDEPRIVELLLQHRADPNASINSSSTILHCAVDLQLYAIACRLVQFGARMDAMDGLANDKMVFEKVTHTHLRQLLAHIAAPPTWVRDSERRACMVCLRAFSRFRIGAMRRHHCRHCGRLCCGPCSQDTILLPTRFAVGRKFTRGTTQQQQQHQRVCKTCSVVLHARNNASAAVEMTTTWSDVFVNKVVGCTWDEMVAERSGGSSRRRSGV